MDKLLRLLAKYKRIAYPVAGLVVLLGLSGGVLAASGTVPTSSSSTPTASATPASSTSTQVAGFPAAGGADNIVRVINRVDSRFRLEGRVQLNQIPGPNVGPKNEALAYSSCVGCRTVAIAVQVDLVSTAVRNFQPLNAGIAANGRCSGCATGAFAEQVVIQVADPTQIPSDVRQQLPTIDQEIKDYSAKFSTDQTTDPVIALANAEAFADGISSQLQTLAGSTVDVKKDLQTAPNTPGASPLASEPASPAASTTPTVSAAPTESSSPSPQPSSSP